MELNKEHVIFFGILAAILAVFFYAILGISGVLSILAIILIFIVPVYFILDNFELEKDEKLIFSFFISTGIFPIFSYWLGLFLSFKLAIVITFILLIGIGFLVRKIKKSKNPNKNQN